MREYFAWLEQTPQYLAGPIAMSNIVGVDHNDMIEADGIVRKYFLFGYGRA